MDRFVLAIDGPSGAGKSTVARLVAKSLNLQMLDTGAMYRCVALAAGPNASPEEAAEKAAAIKIEFDGDRVMLDGEDVSDKIRSLEISQRASRLSVHPPLRKHLVGQQQRIIEEGRWVLEGRDTTTVVAPDADLKIFLTASIEERARRRWKELKSDALTEVVKETVERDHRDYTRPDSPLMLAEDAHIIETFGRTPEEVAEAIVSLA